MKQVYEMTLLCEDTFMERHIVSSLSGMLIHGVVPNSTNRVGRLFVYK